MLQLRPYQQECVTSAKKANTIVHLPTGYGKTLIAAHLINYFLDKNPEKKVAMLVPTRALVGQQSSYLKAHCRVSGSPPIVQTLVGEDQAGWNHSDWNESMRCHIYVGTAALFQQAFVTDRFLDIRRFSLIVFDECHNCTGNSPMAAVMRDGVARLRIQKDPCIPRILGLTASFVNGSLKNMAQKRRNLEFLLQSTIFCPTVPARFSEDKYIAVSWKREEDIGDQKQAIEDHVSDAIGYIAEIKEIVKVVRYCSHVFEEIGKEALFFYIEHVIVKQILEKAKCLQERVRDERSIRYAERMQEKLPLLRDELDSLSEKLKKDPELRDADKMSSKLETLIVKLREIFASNGDSFRGIVFVEQVCLVSALAKMLNGAFQPMYSFGAVSGTGFQTDRDRQEQLDKFKSGELQVLVSSAALEEGIDVTTCGFVVRYTSIATTKAHIQGSGRARHRDAVIYYFENNPVTEHEKEAALNATARETSLSLTVPEQEKAARLLAESKSSRHPYPPSPLESVSASCEEGQVNVFNSKQIFNRYCSMALGTQVQPKKDLYTYSNEPGERKILESIRYPTPDGWQFIWSDEYREFWKSELNMESIFSSAERVKRKSASDKEEMCFVYVIVVRLRETGLLDSHNRPDSAKRFDTQRNCPLIQERSSEIAIRNRVIQSAL